MGGGGGKRGVRGGLGLGFLDLFGQHTEKNREICHLLKAVEMPKKHGKGRCEYAKLPVLMEIQRIGEGMHTVDAQNPANT